MRSQFYKGRRIYKHPWLSHTFYASPREHWVHEVDFTLNWWTLEEVEGLLILVERKDPSHLPWPVASPWQP